jgi:hypothetical protein
MVIFPKQRKVKSTGEKVILDATKKVWEVKPYKSKPIKWIVSRWADIRECQSEWDKSRGRYKAWRIRHEINGHIKTLQMPLMLWSMLFLAITK